jgi:hypothetical protein
MVKLAPQQIGKCGELFVQYILLKHGVESAPLTTDTGIDLVAFPNVMASPEERRKPLTIQVKTSTHHDVLGDKWLEWQIPDDCPADYIATVDFVRNKFWLIRTEEIKKSARHTSKGRLRLWWSLPGYESRKTRRKEEQFKEYEMETAIPKVFGLE